MGHFIAAFDVATACGQSRADAKARGLVHYFTGKPCKRGHVDRRLTSNGKCMACGRQHALAYHGRNLDKCRARNRAWKAANRDKVQACRARNRLTARENQRVWDANNTGKVQAARLNYVARKQGAPGSYTAADVADILKMQRGRCAECRRRLPANRRHVDHIQPLARRGTNYRRNLQIMCARCNQSKGAKDPLEFARQQGRLL